MQPKVETSLTFAASPPLSKFNRRLIPGLLILLFVALATPVILTPIPPLLDYPNHLVRFWLLGGGIQSAPFDGIYKISWNLLTNIGLDLISLPLLSVLSAQHVGSVFILAATLLPPLGVIVLNRSVFAGSSWWMTVVGLLAWNEALIAGFLNFEVGLGLALLFAALEPALSTRGQATRFAVRFAVACALGVMHVFALFFYASLLCGWAMGPDWRRWTIPKGLLDHLGRALFAGAPALAALALLVTMSPTLPGVHDGSADASVVNDFLRGLHQLATRDKIKAGMVGLLSYQPILDIFCWVVVAGAVGWSLWRKTLRVHSGFLLLAAALAFLFLVTPSSAMGTGWIDRRFAFMLPLVVVAGLRPDLPARASLYLPLGVTALALARTAVVAALWSAHQGDLESLKRAASHIPEGSKVIPLIHESPRGSHPAGRYMAIGEATFWHVPLLTMMSRHAFLPTLFTAAGKQPVLVREPWDQLAVAESPGLSIHALTDPSIIRVPREARYLDDWRNRFDFILVVNADLPDSYGPATMPPETELVVDEGFAALYRIRGASASPAPR